MNVPRAGIFPDNGQSNACDSCTFGKGDMMKSVKAMENREERRKNAILRLFTLVAVVCIGALLLTGCAWQHPGETRAEVDRRHQRVMRLNNEGMLSDLDRALLLDRPSKLTDKRIP